MVLEANTSGLATNERAAQWGHCEGNCRRCNNTEETVNHLVLDCPQAASKWQSWRTICREENWQIQTEGDVIDLVDSVWKGNKTHKISLFTKITWQIWLERNDMTYNNKNTSITFAIALKMARDLLSAEIEEGSDIHSTATNKENASPGNRNQGLDIIRQQQSSTVMVGGTASAIDQDGTQARAAEEDADMARNQIETDRPQLRGAPTIG
ncbi:hypothetical protein R1sor_017546 [Riccia sorocarpa]|uniref:Reverse transcriptase zinc-binding domain-containing protein n=1 Tax=Riccia sorocarpa TaxID=122646 RepID=A0ABD3IAH4_9MARC